jgi:type VI secretion system protein ImpC
MQQWLQDWIMQYVLGNPESAPEQRRAEKPLREASVVVEEVEGNPGYYTSKFYLRPHYQLEGLNVTLSLVARLPTVQRG